MIPYSPTFQLEASEELANIDDEGYQHIVIMLKDYNKTRESIRSCLN